MSAELSHVSNSDDWDRKYQVLTVTIQLIALAFPAVTVVVMYFNYQQIQKQISISTDQNTFSNYFKHRESFYEYAEKHNTTDITHANLLYNIMYPDSHKTTPCLDKDFNRFVSSLIESSLQAYVDSYDKSADVREDTARVTAARFNIVFNILGIDSDSNRLLSAKMAEIRAVSQLNGMVNTEFYSLIRPQLQVMEYVIIHLNKQAMFDRDYEPSKQVGVFLKYSNIWSVQGFKAIQQQYTDEVFDPSAELLQMFKNVLNGNGMTRH